MRIDAEDLAAHSSKELLRCNAIFKTFYGAQVPHLAEAGHEMPAGFSLAGG